MIKSGYFAAGDMHWISIGMIRYSASLMIQLMINKSYTSNINIDELLFHLTLLQTTVT